MSSKSAEDAQFATSSRQLGRSSSARTSDTLQRSHSKGSKLACPLFPLLDRHTLVVVCSHSLPSSFLSFRLLSSLFPRSLPIKVVTRMSPLTTSPCSSYSLISSLDALSITSSARPSTASHGSRASTIAQQSSRRVRLGHSLSTSNRELIMPLLSPTEVGQGSSRTNTQSGVTALTKASLATLIDVRQKPNSPRQSTFTTSLADC